MWTYQPLVDVGVFTYHVGLMPNWDVFWRIHVLQNWPDPNEGPWSFGRAP